MNLRVSLIMEFIIIIIIIIIMQQRRPGNLCWCHVQMAEAIASEHAFPVWNRISVLSETLFLHRVTTGPGKKGYNHYSPSTRNIGFYGLSPYRAEVKLPSLDAGEA